ncbi:MAG: hypothetical protein R3Y43_08405 [Alphaproteobacteria bacterium]
MTKLDYELTAEFNKDFKKLLKRYKTLEDDFNRMKRFAIETCYLNGIDNGSIVPIEGFCANTYKSNKVRKFACASLKGGSASGIRVIFVHELEENKITFIEIYYKGDKENEDRARLQEFIDGLNE